MRAAQLLALLALAGACRRREAPPRPAPATATPATSAQPVGLTGAPSPPDDPAGSYRVVEVRDGATVSGRVVFFGAPPAASTMEVPPHGDPGHCGATQPLRPLVVGPDGGVEGAVVWLEGVTRGKAPGASGVHVDQRACRYEPRVSSLTVGGELHFTNSDPGVFHNVHAYYGLEGDDAWFNEASPTGVDIRRRVTRAGPLRLLCDSGHTWMLAYVHVFTHPYHAVTDASGRWSLGDVPPGVYKLRMWHEGWRRADVAGNPRPQFVGHVSEERPVTVNAGQRVEVDLTLFDVR